MMQWDGRPKPHTKISWYYKEIKKLFFIQLTISKEKRDQKYPFTVHLGCFDLEGTVSGGIVIATESVDADRQLISWIDSLGISDGPAETELRLP